MRPFSAPVTLCPPRPFCAPVSSTGDSLVWPSERRPPTISTDAAELLQLARQYRHDEEIPIYTFTHYAMVQDLAVRVHAPLGADARRERVVERNGGGDDFGMNIGNTLDPLTASITCIESEFLSRATFAFTVKESAMQMK